MGTQSENLEELRQSIDSLDREILEMLKQRSDLVTKVALLKRAEGKKIRDSQRESGILRDRRVYAEQLSLPVDEVESIFRMILRASRDQQARLRTEIPEGIANKTIGIIGGKGAIGRRLVELFESLGHTVVVVDIDTALKAKDAVEQSDAVLIAVPILVTEQVIREVGPLMREDQLLFDVTSLKSQPIEAMMKYSSSSVVGTHPMFGPNVHSFQGQRIVLCQGRGQQWYQWLEHNLRAAGLSITEASAEEHDRAMAYVQVLNHFQTQVLGLSLLRSGQSVENTLKFHSPAYLMELYVTARHFSQSPQLYGPIEMENPMTRQVVQLFIESAEKLRDVLLNRDQEDFQHIFEQVRQYFGEFTQEAVDKSGFLIDRLVERT